MNILYFILLLMTQNTDDGYYLDSSDTLQVDYIEVTRSDDGRVKCIDIYYEDEEYFDLIPDEEM